MPLVRLTKSTLNSIQLPSKTTTYYDTSLVGFGLRVRPSGSKTWIVEYRPAPGGRGVPKRRMSIGAARTVTPDQARQQASQILAKVVQGEDPAGDRRNARQADTFAELAERYMAEHVRPKRKPATVKLYAGYLRMHILPAIGSRKAIGVTRADVERLHRTVGKHAKATANRSVAFVCAVYEFGKRSGAVPDGIPNPASKLDKFREKSRDRYLTESEFALLGDAIREAETIGIEWTETDGSLKTAKHTPNKPENRRTVIDVYAAAAIRLLLFTGARLREILDLQWSYLDCERGIAYLPDSKTGQKTLMLGSAALAVLASLQRVGPFVIPGSDFQKPRADLKRPWALVSKRAGLEGVRLHDLRHSFASVGVGSGLSLPVVGKLLGHKDSSTTERYAHLANDPVRQGANAISDEIAQLMGEAVKWPA